jgi:hypothetical protein
MVNAQPIYTGLIIDAKGLGIQPSLSPQITDMKDRVIYGEFDYVDPNFVINEGIVQYAESVEVAKELDLSGNHPLTIHAIAKGDDPFGSSVVIKDQDGWQVLVANDLKNFLSSYKVTFVVD